MKDLSQNFDDDYEKICYLCRRPESKAGKMVTMPGNISICADCMQRTFDAINQTDINGMFNGMNNMGNFSTMNNQSSASDSGAASVSNGTDENAVEKTEETEKE